MPQRSGIVYEWAIRVDRRSLACPKSTLPLYRNVKVRVIRSRMPRAAPNASVSGWATQVDWSISE
jgi:hypothetical protein